MGREVSYDCKCGYSYIETIGGCADAIDLITSVSQLGSYCKCCGFAQIFISDRYVFDENEYYKTEVEEIGGVEATTKLINKLYKENNKNRCNKCNGELEILKDDNGLSIFWSYLSYRRYEEAKTLECTTCKEFRQVSPSYKEYYLDANTKEVIKEDVITETSCGVCNSEMKEIEVREITKIKKNDEGEYYIDPTFVKCPKCNKFDIEESLMHWH